jgi:hypothetical protein
MCYNNPNKLEMLGKIDFYVKRLGILLITVFLIGGMVGCGLFPQNVEILTWYDLDAVRNNLGGHYILMNDLDSTTGGYEELASPTANQGKGWQPIGTGNSPFTGTFDGQGYDIRDLFINRPDEDFVGLFGIVDEGGRIEDIGVVNADVTGGYEYVGGLGGGNVGTVSNSYASGSISGEEFVGGLVGFNGETGTVSNSYSSSRVTGSYGVGGLVGGNVGIVSNSYSSGNVTGENGAGGLVGFNGERGTVSKSYSTGSVTGYAYVGGLVGGNADTVSDSFWDIETSGQATSAGGTGKNTTEMQYTTTFSGVGWNIIAVADPGTRNPSYIWNIVNGVTYPFLSWQS